VAQRARLATSVDTLDPRADRVSLLTLHAAKGLEFPVVFIVGCEEGLLPLAFGDEETADVDEERRLFFVGLTRAQQTLVLTHARARICRGRRTERHPSPFLRDLADELLERSAGGSGGGRRKAQLDLFGRRPT
jgi:DNA helicase-2/ATP-dependent DNA helicase PcrA